jgi:hypothetical protein
MAKGIQPYSVNAPGFHGLNKQDSNLDIGAGFATVADNCVIDMYGRIGARKGWTKATSASSDLLTNDITAIKELITNTGDSYILCTGGGMLFKYTGGALVRLTYGGGGVAPDIQADNWKIVTLNGIAYFYQRGYEPLIFDPITSATTFRRESEHASYTGTAILANEGLSAYGRLWSADTLTDKNTIKFSDLLNGYANTGGTSGTLNLIGVWPNGSDEIVALAAHNNFLVIFGKRQILIYSGANTPSTMTLYDAIGNIGCIARDSVQDVGEDLIFLSNTGVRSLMRTIQEKSSPMRNLSKNVRDHLLEDVSQEVLADIKSCFSEKESFYLMSLPVTGEVYVFDTRHQLEDGSSRITIWTDIEPTAMYVSRDQTLYLGKPGFLCTYGGYLDDTADYLMKYYTGYLHFDGSSMSSILKKIAVTVIGGSSQQISFKYAFDYSSNFRSETVYITTGNVSYYGVSMYNEPDSFYSTGIFTDIPSIQAGGAGKILQFGFETTVSGSPVSIQRIDIYTKSGKIL